VELGEEDVSYEERLKRNPLDLVLWLEYLSAKNEASGPVSGYQRMCWCIYFLVLLKPLPVQKRLPVPYTWVIWYVLVFPVAGPKLLVRKVSTMPTWIL